MKISFKYLKIIVVIIVITLFYGNLAAAQKPVSVVDGDSFWLDGEKIRLWGIDAPEAAQTCLLKGDVYPCGTDARFLLAALTAGHPVTCQAKDHDRFGRTVAQCFAGGLDLAGEMVRQGYALDWPRYSGGAYSALQKEAETAKRGLWAGKFTLPWEWR